MYAGELIRKIHKKYRDDKKTSVAQWNLRDDHDIPASRPNKLSKLASLVSDAGAVGRMLMVTYEDVSQRGAARTAIALAPVEIFRYEEVFNDVVVYGNLQAYRHTYVPDHLQTVLPVTRDDYVCPHRSRMLLVSVAEVVNRLALVAKTAREDNEDARACDEHLHKWVELTRENGEPWVASDVERAIVPEGATVVVHEYVGYDKDDMYIQYGPGLQNMSDDVVRCALSGLCAGIIRFRAPMFQSYIALARRHFNNDEFTAHTLMCSRLVGNYDQWSHDLCTYYDADVNHIDALLNRIYMKGALWPSEAGNQDVKEDVVLCVQELQHEVSLGLAEIAVRDTNFASFRNSERVAGRLYPDQSAVALMLRVELAKLLKETARLCEEHGLHINGYSKDGVYVIGSTHSMRDSQMSAVAQHLTLHYPNPLKITCSVFGDAPTNQHASGPSAANPIINVHSPAEPMVEAPTPQTHPLIARDATGESIARVGDAPSAGTCTESNAFRNLSGARRIFDMDDLAHGLVSPRMENTKEVAVLSRARALSMETHQDQNTKRRRREGSHETQTATVIGDRRRCDERSHSEIPVQVGIEASNQSADSDRTLMPDGGRQPAMDDTSALPAPSEAPMVYGASQAPIIQLLTTSDPYVAEVLRELYKQGNNCIVWSLVVLWPDLATLPQVQALCTTCGPYRYGHIRDMLSETISLTPALRTDLSEDGMFLVHTPPSQRGGIGCCRPVILRKGMGGVVSFSPSSAGDPVDTFSANMLSDGDVIFRVDQPGKASASSIDTRVLRLLAGSHQGNEPGEDDQHFSLLFAERCGREIKDYTESLRTYGSNPGASFDGKLWQCRLCIQRTFGTKQRLIEHCQSQHAASSISSAGENCQPQTSNANCVKGHGAAYGTLSRKQVKLMNVMWDHDVIRSAVRHTSKRGDGAECDESYMQRSADLIRGELTSCPSWKSSELSKGRVGTHVDDHFSLLLDGPNTRYVLRDELHKYHPLGQSFWCTDYFLNSFVAAMLYSPSRGGFQMYISRLADECGLKGPLLPAATGPLIGNIVGKLMSHPSILDIVQHIRDSTPKTIIEIDAQYSVLNNVLYQIPHGEARDGLALDESEMHAIITVRASRTTLIVSPKPSENIRYQLQAIAEVLPTSPSNEVGLIFSDDPVKLDDLATFSLMPNAILAKDPIHIALKVEKASGGSRTPLSRCLRRILMKFIVPYDDQLGYASKGSTHGYSYDAWGIASAMSDATARRHFRRMESKGYSDTPYTEPMQFVTDIAALMKYYNDQMHRKVAKKTIVRSSLQHATSELELGYLFNGPRFLSRNPVPHKPYGTTGVEALHGELANEFRCVKQQTKEYADAVLRVFILRKLLSALSDRLPLHRSYGQTERLRRVSNELKHSGLEWGKHFKVEAKQRMKYGDVKRRPGTKVAARVMKRPSSGLPVRKSCRKKPAVNV